jgi:hypothetical protein
MYNPVTDRYGLVQSEIVRALPVFGHRISAVDGYSLEVFRGEIHRGSVRTRIARSTSNKPVQKKVYNGNVIFKVSLVSCSVQVVGNLTTKDNYVRMYDVTIDLIVSDPLLFLNRYRLSKDPMNLAIERFKSTFQRYASQREYNNLFNFKRPVDAWNDSLCEYSGMKLVQISQWDLRDDSKRLEMAAIQQDAEKNKLSIKLKAEIQKLEDEHERERDVLKREHERGEKRKQNEFEREEEMLQHMHDLHYRLRETAAQELTDILRERIRYTFERDGSINEVAEDSLKLLNAFHESLHKGSVVDSTLSNGSSENVKGTSPDAHTISSDEDTTIEDGPTTDPVKVPPDMSDLSSTKQKEADKE